MAKKQKCVALTNDQKNYVKKRAAKIANALLHNLQQYNAQLSIDMEINPDGRTICIKITQPTGVRKYVRTVATIKGKFDLKWEHGKELLFHAKFSKADGPDQHQQIFGLHQKRAANVPDTLNAITALGLPKYDPALEVVTKKQRQQARIRVLHSGAHDGVKRKRPKRKSTPKETIELGEDQYRYITHCIATIQRNMLRSRRFRKIFEHVAIDWRNEIDTPGKNHLTLDISVRSRAKFRQASTPREILIKGDLNLRWRGGKWIEDGLQSRWVPGKVSKLEFAPASGLPTNGVKISPINLTKKPGDITREIANLIIAAGKVAAPKRTQKFSDNDNDAPTAAVVSIPKRSDRPRPKRYDRATAVNGLSPAQFKQRVMRGQHIN